MSTVMHNLEKLPNGWKFRSPLHLRTLVATNQAVDYFRQLLRWIEENRLVNFHLKIQSDRKKNDQMDVLVFYNDDQIPQDADSVSICSSCDVTHELSQTTMISDNEFTYAWLDFRNRPKLILTPKRHVERLSELNDDNGEMAAFWRDTVELIDREFGSIDTTNYPLLSLNQGTYRKHAHLHLKIDCQRDLWNDAIVPRYREKLDYLAQLLKQTALISDCFSERQFEQEIRKGVIGTEIDQLKLDQAPNNDCLS